MSLLALSTLGCVALFFYTGFACGKQRAKHDVPPGTVEGPEEFKRHYRSQANLLEALVMYLPSAWLFGMYGSPPAAGVLTLVFLGGRVMYHRAYVADPATRTMPFVVGIGSTALAWIAALISILISAAS